MVILARCWPRGPDYSFGLDALACRTNAMTNRVEVSGRGSPVSAKHHRSNFNSPQLTIEISTSNLVRGGPKLVRGVLGDGDWQGRGRARPKESGPDLFVRTFENSPSVALAHSPEVVR